MKQMVLNFLIFSLIVGVIYVLAYPDSRLAASASAIRQIWSGSCRLSCCQSLNVRDLNESASGHYQDKGCWVANHSRAGPNGGCICESCPCALIDNVLRTCQPATTMYSRVVDFIASCCYTVIQTMSDMYDYMQRVLSCRTSCQRPAQIIETQDSTSENIYFGNKTRNSLEKAREHIRKSESSSKPLNFRDKPEISIPPQKSDPKKGEKTKLKPKKEESSTSEGSNSCPRCIEQGKVCMKNCPKAYAKKK